MSNLQNLTSRIIKESELKAEKIINEANNKKEETINKKREEANKISTSMLLNAQNESKSLIERAISKAELEARNKKLIARQTVLNKVFEEAENKLKKMNHEVYQQFMTNVILSLDIDGDEEIIMSTDDKAKLPKDFILNLNNELNNNGKFGNLKFSNDERNLSGGFIISKGGIEINNSFKAMITSLRDELEYGVNKILFDEN